MAGITLGLSKNYLKYINDIVKNDDDTYNIKFLNSLQTFKKNGIKKSVANYVEANKDELENLLNVKEEKEQIKTEIALKQETALILKEETQSFIENNIEDLKAMLMEYRLRKGTGEFNNFNSYIKLDIPQEIKDINIDTVLSIKGNKATYKKFKNFAEIHGISVSVLLNYLIYSLLSGFNAW